MKAFTLIELLVVIAIFVVLLACLGGGMLEAPFQILVGWAVFLWRVIPAMQLDIPATLTAVVCLTGLAWGLHLFLSWLYAHSRTTETEGEPPRRWQLRWTLSLLSVVVLMFIAGTAAVGVTHQTSWLLTSPEPLVGGKRLRDIAARAQSNNHLRQIGLALHDYNDKFQQMPPGCTVDAEGNLLHGWQTALLPFIEQAELHKQIDLKVAWNDPRNAAPFREVVRTYQHAAIDVRTVEGFAASHYAGNVHVLGGEVGRAMPKDFPDGAVNTILAGEAAGNYRPWGHPMNWRDPARGLNTTPDGFGSPSGQSTLFILGDGSVRAIRNDVSPEVLRALSTPDGGEKVPEAY